MEVMNSAPANRAVVAGRQFIADLTAGIDGKDLITDTLRVPRNILVSTWRATNQIIPIAADGLDRFQKKYVLEDRDHNPYAGTKNSVAKIRDSIRGRRIFGTLSTILAEATDGPVDDLGHAILGSPKTMIKPV